jgi:integrase
MLILAKLSSEFNAWEGQEVAIGKVTISSVSRLEGWLWDSTVIGFGARRQTTHVHYYVRYRMNGGQVMKSIGRHGAPWTPETARNEARRLLGVVATGVDPYAQSLSGEAFTTAVDRYLDRKRSSLKPTSFSDTERYLRNHAAPLHRLTLAQIDRRKIAALLGDIETNSGSVARNRGRSALSAFFAWCIAEGLLDVNPVAGTSKANEGGSRERVLGRDELRRLWRGLGDGPFDDVVRLLLLTGQRRDEIGDLSWPEVNLAQGLITLPAIRVKNNRDHTLPLSAQAVAILSRQPHRNSSGFVFGDRGFTTWSTAKAALDARLDIPAWRLHDLRRTMATQLGELGVQPHHIEAVLNHYSGHRSGVAGVYQRAKYSDEMRAGLQRWADHLDQIVA